MKRAREVLARAASVATPLWTDLGGITKRAAYETTKYRGGYSDLDEALFWHKSLVRAFFYSADALCFALRRLVAENAQYAGLELEPGVLLQLRDDSARISFHKSIRMAFRRFPLLFGVDHQLNLNTPDWRAFRRLVSARRRLTHPDCPADLRPFTIFPALGPALEWFFGEWREILVKCGARCGLHPTRCGERQRMYRFDEAASSGYEALENEAAEPAEASNLERFSALLFGLMSDTGLALGSVMERTKVKPTIELASSLRLLVGTLFSEIEGTIAAIQDLSERAAGIERRADLLIGDHQTVLERILTEVDRFSNLFGTGRVVSRSGQGVEDFVRLRERRNRIAHPRVASDLDLGLDALELTTRVLTWWHEDVHKSLVLNATPRVRW